MKFGLAFASSLGTDPKSALDLCRRAEAVGFESIWCGEHVVRPTRIESPYPYTEDGRMPGEDDTSIPDPLIWLAYVAAAAPTLRLGTCILILPQRNPLVLAKELATLDCLSAGRVELGIGIGWLEEEFTALGIPFRGRGARTDEYVAALRALWAGPHAEFHGKFVDFEPVTCSPRPVQPSIPITVGGNAPGAVHRAARLGNGYFPIAMNSDDLRQRIADLGAAVREVGRDPAEIEVSALFASETKDPAAGIATFEELGVSRAMVPAFSFAGPGGLERLSRFAEKAMR